MSRLNLAQETTLFIGAKMDDLLKTVHSTVINKRCLKTALTACFLLLTTLCYAGQVDTTKAVIHHTASHDVSAKTIDQWHKERGWDGIGYHYVIRANGVVENGRPIWKKGAHAKGRNGQVGIVLTGYDRFTSAQVASLSKLIRRLGIKSISRHHDKCPSEGLDIEKLRKELKR